MRKEMLMEAEIQELYAGLCREAAHCELHALGAVKEKHPEQCPICTAPRRRFLRITA